MKRMVRVKRKRKLPQKSKEKIKLGNIFRKKEKLEDKSICKSELANATRQKEKLENKPSGKSKSGKAAKEKRVLIAATVMVLLITSVLGVTFSRYVTSLKNDQVIVPTNFYFESNYLDEEGTTYNVYTTYVDIDIRNHDNLKYTLEDLDYTIAITATPTTEEGEGEEGSETASDDNSDGSSENEDDGSAGDSGETLAGTLVISDAENSSATATEGNTYNSTLSYDIVSNDGGTNSALYFDEESYRLTASPGDTVTITATSSDPYEKTISATFVFHDPDNETFYRIYDYVYYKEVWIFTGESPSDITITYDPDYYAPDTMNDFMEDWIVEVEAVDNDNHATYVEVTYTGTLYVDTTPYGEATTEEDSASEADTNGEDTSEDATSEEASALLLPNGCYVLIFFENELTDWKTIDDIILNSDNSFAITMPTESDIVAESDDESSDGDSTEW